MIFMEETLIIPILIVIGITAVEVLADSLLKIAGSGATNWSYLIAGVIIYGLMGFGWFFVLKQIKLSIGGPIYASFIILLTVATGVFYFKEQLMPKEIAGILFALGSLVLLGRFL